MRKKTGTIARSRERENINENNTLRAIRHDTKWAAATNWLLRSHGISYSLLCRAVWRMSLAGTWRCVPMRTTQQILHKFLSWRSVNELHLSRPFSLTSHLLIELFSLSQLCQPFWYALLWNHFLPIFAATILPSSYFFITLVSIGAPPKAPFLVFRSFLDVFGPSHKEFSTEKQKKPDWHTAVTGDSLGFSHWREPRAKSNNNEGVSRNTQHST